MFTRIGHPLVANLHVGITTGLQGGPILQGLLDDLTACHFDVRYWVTLHGTIILAKRPFYNAKFTQAIVEADAARESIVSVLGLRKEDLQVLSSFAKIVLTDA